jgi:tetratricopeptide (TPR) repeat protein
VKRLFILIMMIFLALPVLAQEAEEEPQLVCDDFVGSADDVRVGYYMGEGSGFVATGQYLSAIDSYGCIIQQIDASYVGAYIGRAVAYTGMRDFERAMADYDSAIERDGSFVAAYNNRGVVHAALLDYEAALADFNEVLSLDSNYVMAYNNRAVVNAINGDFDAAIADLEQAIEISGVDVALADLQDPDRPADAPFPEFNRDYAQSYALLGIIYSAQALEQYQNYLTLRGSGADQRVQSAAGALQSRFTFDLRLDDGTWLLTADFTSTGEEVQQ